MSELILSDSQRDDEAEDDRLVRASMENQHWVEELFPPAFGFTVDEILTDIGKKEEQPEMTTFEKYANRVSPLDTSAIKNVYERVWLIQSIQRDELRKYQENEGESQAFRSSFRFTRGSETVDMRHAVTSTHDLATSHKGVDADHCIWSSNEISVLREVFQSARLQNKQLQARLAELNHRYEKMHDKHKQQQNTLESTERKLNEAIKSNKRLHILSQNLNSQLKTANHKTDFLREQLELFKQDRDTFEKNAHESKLLLDKERLERQTIQLNLERQTKEASLNQMIHEEQFKASHEQQLNRLRKRIDQLEIDLATERKDHERSKRGLEHLRTHFASLPDADNISKTNMVVEDELQKWST